MNVILIHGAWHTEKCWADVIQYLAPTTSVTTLKMPGRIYSASPEYKRLSLIDYVDTLEAKLLEIGQPTVLVGHSLAGLTISQVNERIPHLVKKLVYVAGFIPLTGETMFDVAAQMSASGISPALVITPKENKVEIKSRKLAQQVFYNTCSASIATAAANQLVVEPLKAFTIPVTLSSKTFDITEKYYIKCEKDQAILTPDQEKMIQNGKIDQVIHLDCDHSPFFSAPKALAQAIMATI